MKMLAIETSTMLGGIAILDDAQGLVFESRLNVRTTHSERLMTEIDHALRQTGSKITDFDVFAVGIGPGSFTGLRIGLSTVKGFSFATGKPLVAVPTLEAFAWNFPCSVYPVCPMLDARRGEVYAAVFKWRKDCFERIVDEVSIKPLELLKKFDGPVVFAGEGAALYRAAITDVMGDNAVFAPEHLMVPSPAGLAYLGLKKALAGGFSDPAGLVPCYIRRSEAEVKAVLK